MILPLFKDIGKQAKDLFEKNFYFDCIKLQMKNSLNLNLSYDGSNLYSMKDGKMLGKLKCEYKYEGVTFTPQISTDSSSISGKLEVRRPEFKGVDWNIMGNYNPQDGMKHFEIGGYYKGPNYNIEFTGLQNDLNLKSMDPLMNTKGVINLSEILFGIPILIGTSLTVNPKECKIVASNLTGAYEYEGYIMALNGDYQKKQVTASAYKKLNEINLQTGLVASFKANSIAETEKERKLSAAICTEFKPNNEVTLKARVNSDLLLGLSYNLCIKEGIIVTMCTEIDAQKLKQGNHKIGFGIEFL